MKKNKHEKYDDFIYAMPELASFPEADRVYNIGVAGVLMVVFITIILTVIASIRGII